MSEEKLSGLAVLEKILGVVILIMGIILFYYTYINTEAAGLGANLFIATGIALIILGLIFTVAKMR